MALVTKTQLENAASDASTLESFVNGTASPGTITTRTGQSLKTLARIQQDVLAAAAVPIWARINLGASPWVVASSGGFTVTKEAATGIYKVAHASFTAAMTLVLTAYAGPGLGVNHYAATPNQIPGAGYAFIMAFDTSTKTAVDTVFQVNLMTFPQML